MLSETACFTSTWSFVQCLAQLRLETLATVLILVSAQTAVVHLANTVCILHSSDSYTNADPLLWSVQLILESENDSNWRERARNIRTSFSPINRYYANPSEAFPWKSLYFLHIYFLCSETQNSISSNIPPYLKTTCPEHSYKHSFFCFKSGDLVCQCQAVRIPLHPHQLTSTE